LIAVGWVHVAIAMPCGNIPRIEVEVLGLKAGGFKHNFEVAVFRQSASMPTAHFEGIDGNAHGYARGTALTVRPIQVRTAAAKAKIGQVAIENFRDGFARIEEQRRGFTPFQIAAGVRWGYEKLVFPEMVAAGLVAGREIQCAESF